LDAKIAPQGVIIASEFTLLAKGVNPDRLSHEAVAAELTNHLVDGVVLTPGIVAAIPELQLAGFHYMK